MYGTNLKPESNLDYDEHFWKIEVSVVSTLYKKSARSEYTVF